MPPRSIDAVSHPVRLAMVRALANRDSATLGDLADAAGVHLNTARAHAGALLDAGALERSSMPGPGRGRPQIVYRLASGWGLPGASGDLDRARLLRETLGALGFRVEARRRELRLAGCPCPKLSPGSPEVICGLADAVADGVLSGSGSQRRVVSAQHDPARRRCRLHLG